MNDATVVFDLDGTLVDTAPDLVNATNHVLDGLRLPPVEECIARPWISNGARHMITQALAHAGAKLTEEEIDRELGRFLVHYEDNIANQSRPFPGAVEALQKLRDQGARLAVCTNKRENLARKLLQELGLINCFHALTGRDTLDVFKPHPGHITGTVKLANGNVSRSIMIGDSANDIIAAKAANIPAIAVTFGYSSTPVEELGADSVIDSYDKLIPQIARLLPAKSETV